MFLEKAQKHPKKVLTFLKNLNENLNASPCIKTKRFSKEENKNYFCEFIKESEMNLGPKKDGSPNLDFFQSPESLQGFETVRLWLQKHHKKVSD